MSSGSIASPRSVDASAWNELLDAQAAPTPFMRHEYLLALHESASAVPDSGWAPQILTLESGGTLAAGCALYLKSHSYGEYVFDWAWADAYRRHGLRYYPKLLGAVPFTPVPGTRLLARDDAGRDRLVHADPPARAGRRAVVGARAVPRRRRPRRLRARRLAAARGRAVPLDAGRGPSGAPTSPTCSPGCSATSARRSSRSAAASPTQGVRFRALEGAAITAADWDFFYRCYTLTYQAHHSTPYLTRDFFARMAATMARHWVMFVADRDGAPIAASLVAIDPERGAAWGRYWGCTEPLPCLHFEACYYQPLAWCLANGYRRFEGGAQGEHKMARGLLPVRTFSAHWLRDERFASAVADFLSSEGAGVEQYVDELRERNPFKVNADR